MNTRFYICKYYVYYLMIGFIAYFVDIDLYSQTDSLKFNYSSVSSVEATNKLELYPYFEIWVDSSQYLNFEQVYKNDTLDFLPAKNFLFPLSPEFTYWGRIFISNSSSDTTEWILSNFLSGTLDIYSIYQSGEIIHHQTGKYIPHQSLAIPETHKAVVPLRIPPNDSIEVYVRIEELDNNSILFSPKLFEWGYWYSLDHDPLMKTIFFFEGIFWIMVIYNFIIFCSVGHRAYLFYAFYLMCVATFVLYSVGPLKSPSWGDPILHVHVGHLAFSLINVFYFQFGRSFLSMRELLPKWDKWIVRFVYAKVFIVCLLQIYLFFTFNLKDVLNVEFALLFFEGILSIWLFVALLRTSSTLARFFVAGSAAVISIGLSLAALGYIFSLKHAFVTFLSTIVFEIICFSLGLGYKMRESQRQQLLAEQEKRKVQEQLNQELAKINTAFGRFVPKEFLSSIGRKDVLEIELGDGEEKVVTVMFSDIRSYTTLAEEMTPKENFQFLNAYLGRMGPIIRSNHGFVNQYYGDGIMAIFTHKSYDAIKAAIEMQKELQAYNLDRLEKGRAPIKIGIGLHTGKLIMGVIGDTLRMEAGVVSDTVNTAARMEGLTKFYGASILISEDSLPDEEYMEELKYRYLGKVLVKGRKSPTKIYDFFEGEKTEIYHLKDQTKQLFEQALKAYFSQNFVDTMRLLDEVLAIYPNDLAAQYYREKSAYYLTEGIPEKWTGVEQMLKK